MFSGSGSGSDSGCCHDAIATAPDQITLVKLSSTVKAEFEMKEPEWMTENVIFVTYNTRAQAHARTHSPNSDSTIKLRAVLYFPTISPSTRILYN